MLDVSFWWENEMICFDFLISSAIVRISIRDWPNKWQYSTRQRLRYPLSYFICQFCEFSLGTSAKKKRENVGILKKKQGGGSTRIPLPFFTVFNMGDPPTINVPKVLKCKINHNFFLLTNMTFPNWGEGSLSWEKFPPFPVLAGGGASLIRQLTSFSWILFFCLLQVCELDTFAQWGKWG